MRHVGGWTAIGVIKMYRKRIVSLLLFLAFAPLAACRNLGAHDHYRPEIEVICEIDNTLPEYEPDIAPTSMPDEPSYPLQESEQPEPNAYELCDCGALYAHTVLELKYSPPLNIRDVGPFGVGTHFTYQFETIHTATYLQWESEWPSKIVIWPDEPVYNFTFVSALHTAICCAYVGEVILSVDKLYPSDAVILTVAFWHYLFPRGGIIFTDVSGAQHHMFLQQNMAGGCAPGYLLHPTNHLIGRRENWIDLGIISIPSAFTYDKDGLHNDIAIITNCAFASIRDVWGATQMWAGYLMVESIESMVESSVAAEAFYFDDGHTGYMLEFEYDIWWVRGDWMAMSFRHGGYRAFFEIHEDLILEIARTLTTW